MLEYFRLIQGSEHDASVGNGFQPRSSEYTFFTFTKAHNSLTEKMRLARKMSLIKAMSVLNML